MDPDRQLEIVIVPPPLVADALGAAHIDGFCVGEPWNTAAVTLGRGRIATVKAAIWKSSPEKVLGVHARWADDHPEALAGLLRAIYRAAMWCGEPSNREELAALLARPAYVDRPAAWMIPALSRRLSVRGGTDVPIDDLFVPFAQAATFP